MARAHLAFQRVFCLSDATFSMTPSVQHNLMETSAPAGYSFFEFGTSAIELTVATGSSVDFCDCQCTTDTINVCAGAHATNGRMRESDAIYT